jgi:hypothetical protein
MYFNDWILFAQHLILTWTASSPVWEKFVWPKRILVVQ